MLWQLFSVSSNTRTTTASFVVGTQFFRRSLNRLLCFITGSNNMKNELASIICLLLLSGRLVLVDAFTTVTPIRAGASGHWSLLSPSSSPSFSSSANSKTQSLFSVENDDDIQGEEKEKPAARRKTKLAKGASKQVSQQRFASGEELKDLRLDLKSLRHNLQWAEALKDETRIESLEKAIRNGENRDPDIMYKKSLGLIAQAKKMKDASKEEKDALIEKWADVAAVARQCLPQFNLDGLWVGNYGEHGAQVINITYSEDTLYASKVTGDRNVPRGESTFTVDLSPCNSSALPPIQLMSEHRNGEFQRYPGRGQVSRKGFKDNRYVEGQLILVDDQFSFVWIPTKHHVLFSRPSPEMTLRLLRDTLSKEDELENERNHIARCYEMDLSTCIARQQDPANFEPLRRITTQDELDEAEKRLQQQKERNVFWQLSKWKKYIDQTLDGKETFGQ